VQRQGIEFGLDCDLRRDWKVFNLLMMILVALLSVSASLNHPFVSSQKNAYHGKVDGYLMFQTGFEDTTSSGAPNYYYPFAPDTKGIGHPYSSNQPITDAKVLTMLCDAYSSACQWHNGGANGGESIRAMGMLGYNSTTVAYVKKSIGTITNGSMSSSTYFLLGRSGTNIFCHRYVGWPLPTSLIKQQCDSDEKCDAFIMRVDDSYGELCTFSEESDLRLQLKLV